MNTPNIDQLFETSPMPNLTLVLRRGHASWTALIQSSVDGVTTAPRNFPTHHPLATDLPLIAEGTTREEALAKLEELCNPLPERWAFWTYDLFPYTLGGRIVGVADPEGYVKVDNYGAHKFKPFAVIAGPKGRQLKDTLETLRGEQHASFKALGKSFQLQLRKELQASGVTHPNEVRWAREEQ